jgi:electron-transferring-flavoprotein dehydrogenase
LYCENDHRVVGIRTGDMGISKDGKMKNSFEPGIDILAKQTVFTEGARGSLTERIKEKYDLTKDSIGLQHYGLGLKEVWQVAEGNTHFK